jgi:hypothetical protein
VWNMDIVLVGTHEGKTGAYEIWLYIGEEY